MYILRAILRYCVPARFLRATNLTYCRKWKSTWAFERLLTLIDSPTLCFFMLRKKLGDLVISKESEMLGLPDSCSCSLELAQFYILYEKAKLFPDQVVWIKFPRVAFIQLSIRPWLVSLFWFFFFLRSTSGSYGVFSLRIRRTDYITQHKFIITYIPIKMR